MTVYVCIPINGRKSGTLAEKKMEARRQADIIKRQLEYQGHTVITPFDVVPIDSQLSDAQTLGLCITALCSCEAIYKGPGWRTSKSCQVESITAQVYNIMVVGDEL